MNEELEKWLADQWAERAVHQEELLGLLRAMGSTLRFDRTEEQKKREYTLWRVRMINHWNFRQLPEEEQERQFEEQFRQIRERRARKNAIRDN